MGVLMVQPLNYFFHQNLSHPMEGDFSFQDGVPSTRRAENFPRRLSGSAGETA
jgi:hypothetical protein